LSDLHSTIISGALEFCLSSIDFQMTKSALAFPAPLPVIDSSSAIWSRE